MTFIYIYFSFFIHFMYYYWKLTWRYNTKVNKYSSFLKEFIIYLKRQDQYTGKESQTQGHKCMMRYKFMRSVSSLKLLFPQNSREVWYCYPKVSPEMKEERNPYGLDEEEHFPAGERLRRCCWNIFKMQERWQKRVLANISVSSAFGNFLIFFERWQWRKKFLFCYSGCLKLRFLNSTPLKQNLVEGDQWCR